MYAGDKTVQVRVRLSPDQAARLDSNAHGRGITRSEYIRNALEVELKAEENVRRMREHTGERA